MFLSRTAEGGQVSNAALIGPQRDPIATLLRMKVTPLLACPSCGGTASEPYSIGGSTRLNRCTSCAFVYATEGADPDEVYVDGYLKGESELGFGLDVFHPYFQAFLGYAADVRLRRIARHATPPGRILDIGCGSGEVLLGAMRQGWTAVGVEPVEESAKIAQDRGIDVRATTLEDSGLEEHSFDVVTAFHVLEHMSDANGFLRSMARYARPGGRVVVEVPNLRSVHRISYGAAWPGLRPLEHLGHFTPATMAATFRHAGIEDVSVGTLGFLWRGQSLGEMLNDLGLHRFTSRLQRLGRQCEVIGRQEVVPRRPTWLALRLTQALYDMARMGEAIFAIGRTRTT